jgi:hypothetical protein
MLARKIQRHLPKSERSKWLINNLATYIPVTVANSTGARLRKYGKARGICSRVGRGRSGPIKTVDAAMRTTAVPAASRMVAANSNKTIYIRHVHCDAIQNPRLCVFA